MHSLDNRLTKLEHSHQQTQKPVLSETIRKARLEAIQEMDRRNRLTSTELIACLQADIEAQQSKIQQLERFMTPRSRSLVGAKRRMIEYIQGQIAALQ